MAPWHQSLPGEGSGANWGRVEATLRWLLTGGVTGVCIFKGGFVAGIIQPSPHQCFFYIMRALGTPVAWAEDAAG